jgi:hypothetical protein
VGFLTSPSRFQIFNYIKYAKNPLLIFRHSPEPEEGGAGSGDDEQNAGYRFGEQLVLSFPPNF